MYCLLVLCHCAHCCRLESLHYLSVHHNGPSVRSVSLCPLLSSRVSPLSVSTSQCTVCSYCVTMSTTVFCSLSSVNHYATLYRLLIECHHVHWCFFQSVHCLLIPQNIPSDFSVSVYLMLSGTVFPRSLPHTVPSMDFFSLLHCFLLQSLDSQWVPESVPSDGFFSLYLLVSSTLSPLSVSISYCNFGLFCVTVSTVFFYCLSSMNYYIRRYRLLVLCHCVQGCIIHSVHCL